jgi:hypothetical protein
VCQVDAEAAEGRPGGLSWRCRRRRFGLFAASGNKRGDEDSS